MMKKKITFCILMIAILFCLYECYSYKQKEKIYQSLSIVFHDKETIEYGEKIDFKDYIKDYKGTLILPDIDTKQVGKKEYCFVVYQDHIKKEYKKEIEIIDTNHPIISLKENQLILQIDDDFDMKDYIDSVYDQVDGGLDYKKTLEKNSYTYLNNVDIKKSGTYHNKIIAMDRNGNQTEKTIDVIVKEKKRISNNKIIVIDAGHQGKGNNDKEQIGPHSSIKKAKVTTGATGQYSKKRESVINLEVALKLEKELKKRGYTVIMTRTSQNVNLSNQQRAKIGNEAKADAVIHLHCDSIDNSKTKGAHTIAISQKNTYTPAIYKSSHLLASSIINAYCKETGIKNRGVSLRDDLTGLNWSVVPSIYIELGFISHKEEDLNLSSSSFQEKCAKGIADGFDYYFQTGE